MMRFRRRGLQIERGEQDPTFQQICMIAAIGLLRLILFGERNNAEVHFAFPHRFGRADDTIHEQVQLHFLYYRAAETAVTGLHGEKAYRLRSGI